MSLLIEAHGRSYEIEDPGGLIGAPLRAGSPYERHLLEHIYDQHFAGVALDIGAHVGNHALWLAAVCGLEVVAFEPLVHEQLAANVELNPGVGIGVEAVALGADSGRAKSVGRGRLKLDRGGIPVRRLDDYELEGIAVVKIDVEDMEPHVLRGGEVTIRRDRPVIYAEARDEAAHQAIGAVLEPWGFGMTLQVKTATPVEEWRWLG